MLIAATTVSDVSANETNFVDNNMMFDFGSQACSDCQWFVVVDGVMGGRSMAKLDVMDNSIKVSCQISLKNRGGFASIRTPFANYDLSKFTKIKIRYRTTNQSFAMTLSNFRRFYLPRFKHVLADTKGQWSEITILINDFKKMRFSEDLNSRASADELSKIIRLGLISNDKKEGAFTLEIDHISFVK